MEFELNITVIAIVFGLVGLLALIFLLFTRDVKQMTQVAGSILVISITLFADHAAVYTISVFVIATLVTELQFLEKIAALIWNRKEYWKYLESATVEEIRNKVESDVESEFEKENSDEADEAQKIDSVNESADEEGEDIFKDIGKGRKELINEAIQFERDVLNHIEESMPFSYKRFKREVIITSGAKSYVLDGIIETDEVHYLLEIKNINRASTLYRGINQIEIFANAYKNFLRERNMYVSVQPLFIIPDKMNLGESINDIPIVRFNQSDKKFYHLQKYYTGHSTSFKTAQNENELESLLIEFLAKFSKWAFSPLRIQKWGGRQSGFEKLDFYSVKEIREKLEELLKAGKLEERTSKKGNKLYRIKL